MKRTRRIRIRRAVEHQSRLGTEGKSYSKMERKLATSPPRPLPPFALPAEPPRTLLPLSSPSPPPPPTPPSPPLTS